MSAFIITVYPVQSDAAHEADMAALRREQLEFDCDDEVDDDDNLDWEAQYKRQRNESRGRLGLPRIV